MQSDWPNGEGYVKKMEITLQVNAFLLKYLCSSVSICGFSSSFVFQLPDLR